MIKNIFYFAIAAVLLSSCNTGEKGNEGDPGPGYYKSANGSVTATIHYQYPNGDTAIVPSSYQSSLSDMDNVINIDTSGGMGEYSFDIIRYGADDAANFIRISSCWADYDGTDDTTFRKPYNFIFGISRISQGSTLFAFATMSDVYEMNELTYDYTDSDVTLSNYYYNPSTHRLTFDYEIKLEPSYDILEQYVTDGSIYGVVKGKVDVTLLNNPYELDVCYYMD
ncbi:MAG: hypothetical protein U0U66_13210 [Cytophagaceae bacterium]